MKQTLSILTHSLTHSLTPYSTVLLEKLTGLQLVKKFPHFIEPEGSLPNSQAPATFLYSEPAQPSPYPHILLLEIHLNIISPSTPGSLQWSLSLRFPHHNSAQASPLHPNKIPCPSHTEESYIRRQRKIFQLPATCARLV
jgi:hypothetical protein